MNILRELTRGGKEKVVNSLRSGAQDLGTIAPIMLHEPDVETKKVISERSIHDWRFKCFKFFISAIITFIIGNCFSGYVCHVLILAPRGPVWMCSRSHSNKGGIYGRNKTQSNLSQHGRPYRNSRH